jgi:putative FmdB family regulatory protein
MVSESEGLEGVSMPQYLFVCQDCKKEFTETLHFSELEKGQVKCPECGSSNVRHQVEPFFAVTSKKS